MTNAETAVREALAPCPSCGRGGLTVVCRAYAGKHFEPDEPTHWVGCTICEFGVDGIGLDVTVGKWNRRTDAALLAELDAARAEVARLRLDVRTQEALQDSAYRAGMKFGWNCCDAGADDKYRQAMEGGEYIAELKRIRQERAALEASP